MIAATSLDAYRAQRDAGATPAQVYAQSFKDGLSWQQRLDVLTALYTHLDGDAIRAAAFTGHRLACAEVLLMHREGASLAEIARHLLAEGYGRLEVVFTLHALFDLRGPEALRLLS